MMVQRGAKVPTRGDFKKSGGGKSEPVEKRVRPAGAPKMKFADAHALKTLPDQIAKADREIARLENDLAQDGLYARDPGKFAALSDALAKTRAAKEVDEERWLALEMEREALES
jgi:ATP-binding cassette subfamily F protein uup